MTVVSDFTTIVGDRTVSISNKVNAGGFIKKFNTGGRHANGTAYISFMITRLDFFKKADVFVNGTKIGQLHNSPNTLPAFWHAQTVSMAGNKLNNGDNDLKITLPGDAGDNKFTLKNIICHFHQNV